MYLGDSISQDCACNRFVDNTAWWYGM